MCPKKTSTAGHWTPLVNPQEDSVQTSTEPLTDVEKAKIRLHPQKEHRTLLSLYATI